MIIALKGDHQIAHLQIDGYRPELPGRLDHYNHLLAWHHRLPVFSTAVLMGQIGERRLGPPEPEIAAAIEDLAELERVERTTLRVLDAESWAEALAE